MLMPNITILGKHRKYLINYRILRLKTRKNHISRKENKLKQFYIGFIVFGSLYRRYVVSQSMFRPITDNAERNLS